MVVMYLERRWMLELVGMGTLEPGREGQQQGTMELVMWVARMSQQQVLGLQV